MGIIGVNMHGRIYTGVLVNMHEGDCVGVMMGRMGVVCISNQDRVLAASKLIQYLAA